MNPAFLALALIAGFQVKHLLADFLWQSHWMVRTKGIYGHPGGLVHSGIHAASSLAVLIWAGPPAGVLAALIAAEFAVHYHTDWAKDRLIGRAGLGPRDARYWHLTGLDQFVHQLSYVAMTYFAVQATVSQ